MSKARALAAVAGGLVLLSMTVPAGADTRTSAATDLTCTTAGRAGPAGATLPPVTATDSKDTVPEDDLVEVAVDAALPDLGPGVSITGAGLTLPIPTDVANVDLHFEGGTLPARSWDATSGTEIVVTFRNPTPMAPSEVRLPTVVVSYALDQGSAGRTVAWPSFGLVVVTVVHDGEPGLVSCRPRTAPAPLNSTLITAPVGLVRRGAPGPGAGVPGPDAPAAAIGAPAAAGTPAQGPVDGGTGTGTGNRVTGDAPAPPTPAAGGAPGDGQILAGAAPAAVPAPATATASSPAATPVSSPNVALVAVVVALGLALTAVFARRRTS